MFHEYNTHVKKHVLQFSMSEVNWDNGLSFMCVIKLLVHINVDITLTQF